MRRYVIGAICLAALIGYAATVSALVATRARARQFAQQSAECASNERELQEEFSECVWREVHEQLTP